MARPPIHFLPLPPVYHPMIPNLPALAVVTGLLSLPFSVLAVEPLRSAAEDQSLTRSQSLVTPDADLDEVNVRECWIRHTPLPDLPTAAYFLVDNQSHLTLEVTGVQSDAFERNELRQTVAGDGPARMLTISSVPVAPGDTQKFAPGGYHVLLADPVEPLDVGAEVTLTFLFGSDGRSQVPCRVQATTDLQYTGN